MKRYRKLYALCICITATSFLLNTSICHREARTETKEEEVEATPAVVTEESLVLPLEGKIIFVDAGHGIEAAGGGHYQGFEEHEYNLIYAQALKKSLENLGATVVITRQTADDVENLVRMAMVNRYALEVVKTAKEEVLAQSTGVERTRLSEQIDEITRLEDTMQRVINNSTLAEIYFNSPYDYSYTKQIHPDLEKIFEYEDVPLLYDRILFVSIHSNATATPINTLVNGTTTYYITNDWRDSQNYYTQYANVDKSKLAAELLAEAVSEGGCFYNNGAKVNDFFMLRESNLPAVLVEIAYHTNTNDREKIIDPYYQKRIVEKMAFAIVEYFERVAQGHV